MTTPLYAVQFFTGLPPRTRQGRRGKLSDSLHMASSTRCIPATDAIASAIPRISLTGIAPPVIAAPGVAGTPHSFLAANGSVPSGVTGTNPADFGSPVTLAAADATHARDGGFFALVETPDALASDATANVWRWAFVRQMSRPKV